MLKATFEEGNGVITLKVEGHADQAEYGKDIVCSACSILTYTVAQIVADAMHRGMLISQPHIELESGIGIISCEPVENAYNHLKQAFIFAEVGFILLSKEYPQNVDLIMFGTADYLS